ncbi:ABC transporter permease [Spongisporangium articulatum]|uniref:ABC transporter permease n=1 Tax=Spongisporangium articulatum TaxID=3362603 RepID=A0ABW8AMB5_9ACTN
MSAPLDLSGSAAEAQPEAVVTGGVPVTGRSLGQIAWMRLKRDRVALTGGAVVLFLVLVAVFAPLIVALLGHPPNEFHQDQVSPDLQIATGPFGGVSKDFLFGVEPINGRDLFSRVVYGARISMIIGVFSTLLSVVIGGTLGVTAGYFGGWVDTVLSRLMDLFLAFPILIFSIAIAGVAPDRAFGVSGDALRVLLLIFIIGFFQWPYIGRIIRGQTLSLREREFVDAARCLGASDARILRAELLPNLFAPILVYFTLLIPTNILFEAALSFLNVGIRPPTATWGQMLSDATQWYQSDPWFMVVPGTAIFITVLAFNLFGDGLRDALDPRGG